MTALSSEPVVQAATKTVKQDGTGDFTTISACAAAAQAGDTCSIYSGTYHETLAPTVSGLYGTPISFLAAPGANVLVDGINLDSADNIWIQGFQLKSISQYGITWTFDNYYLSGLFANGDYWAQGSLTITSMTPAWNNAHNGWDVNPLPAPTQHYDAGGYNFDVAYRPPTLPYLAQPGSSIVKTLSFIQDSANTSLCYSTPNTTCLQTAAVLTVVGSVPPNNGQTVFRPPYIGTSKPYYSTNNLQLGLLPSLAPVGTNVPALNDPEFVPMKRVQLDHFEGVSDRTARPKLNLPDYGGSVGRNNGDAAVRLMLNDPIQAKMPLLIAYVQGGIDRYYMAANGQTWPGGGGWETGEKLPIAFAGALLNDQNIINLTHSNIRIGDEDGTTSITSNKGVPLWGDPIVNTSFIETSYWDFQLHDPGYNDDGGDFYKFIDGGGNTDRAYSDYQIGIVSPVMKGSALAGFLMPAVKQAWNNQKFFDYCDRWVNVGLWEQPDPCAPVVGVCQGGTNPGAKCTPQTEILNPSGPNGNSACSGGGTCNYNDPATYQNNFGKTYGPDGTGNCILDPNLTPGSTLQNYSCQAGKLCGRYPTRHHLLTDNIQPYGSPFVADMWKAYRNSNPPPPPPAPVITSALTASGTVGSAFSYQITASNSPTSFNATPLPAGLSVNASNGLISGTPSAAGTSSVSISATNAGGTGTATLALTINAAPPPGNVHYVRAGAAGSGNGSSWTNAWPELTNIAWSSITPGSVICIAGGSYSSSLTTGASGASGNPITVKRAVASDPTCGSTSAGWTAAYDAQVVMAPGATIDLQNNFVTIDGMVWHGIKVNVPFGTYSGYAGVDVAGPTNGIILAHIEVAGPCGSNGCAMGPLDPRSINLNSWNGSSYDLQNNMTIRYADLHGACNGIWSAHSANLIIEHTRIADIIETTPAPNNCHENVFIMQDTTFTFRYNEITNWNVEGILAYPGPSFTVMSGDIYGNIWHDPAGVYARILEVQYGAIGPYRFYNNTVVNVPFSCAGTGNGGSYTGTSLSRNNIYWNSAAPCGLPSDDYDYSDKPLGGEAHGQGNAPNPFVNLAGHDYHLQAHTNPGVNLSFPYNTDYDGNTRTTWDRGAYEFGGTPPPPPPAITSALTASGIVGSAFSYQITASNSPTSFNATGLPAGLAVNTSNGFISGTPTSVGTSNIAISATNAGGTGTATLVLTINGAGTGGCDGTGNCYVRAGATGTGVDWANACGGFTVGGSCDVTSAAARGVVFWVAAGSYGDQSFSAPNSGTIPVTIRAATIANHGPAGGWQNNYAGQALFCCSGSDILTNYWIFDGQRRGSDWVSGYNLKFWNQTFGGGHALGMHVAGSGTRTNWTIDYVELMGTNKVGPSYADEGFECYETCSNLYIGHSYIHHVGSDNISLAYGGAGSTDATFEYDYFEHNHSGENDFHSQGFQITASRVIIRYNIFRDIISSGFITSASGGSNIPATWWEVYGNVFFWSSLLVSGAESAGAFVGDGIVANYNMNFSGHLFIYNNTIANIRPGCTTCAVSGRFYRGLSGSASDPPVLDIRNNIVYNSVAVDNGSAGITMDYNSYYGGTTNVNDTSAHAQTLPGNPFVNSSNNDFHLAAGMTGAQAGVALPDPYNKDLDGNLRGVAGNPWDRGAYQFCQGSGCIAPPPPAAPVITSALTASGTVGNAFSYQITASNSPASFNATGLPAGLSVNTSNGLISGTPTAAGSSSVAISASNSGGIGTATLTLTLGLATPPTVSITPLGTTTVSGTVTLTASASSNLGIASVQFQLDGSNLGSSVTAPPFTLSWNTAQAPPGTHSLTAVATDIAGNKTTSAPVTVTVVKTADATPGLRSAIVYPNPVVKADPTIRAMVGVVDSVEVTIFDASGHVVNSGSVSGTPTGIINGQYYYDYKWTGSKASGTYFAVIHGKAVNGAVIRARVKFAVVN